MSLNVTFEELPALVGREIICGSWMTITQDEIDRFADLTGDHQWIHVDRARAERESPWHTTVAHGFLTMGMLIRLMDGGIKVSGSKIGVNYGFDRLRFTDTVRSGDRIRGHFTLLAVKEIEGGVQVSLDVHVEREGHEKPAVVAIWLLRYYR